MQLVNFRYCHFRTRLLSPIATIAPWSFSQVALWRRVYDFLMCTVPQIHLHCVRFLYVCCDCDCVHRCICIVACVRFLDVYYNTVTRVHLHCGGQVLKTECSQPKVSLCSLERFVMVPVVTRNCNT